MIAAKPFGARRLVAIGVCGLVVAVSACSGDDSSSSTTAAASTSAAVATSAAAATTAADATIAAPTTAAPTTTQPPTTTTTTAVRSPTAPAATLEGPITTGTISLPADPKNVDYAAAGYTQEEYFASGTASSYEADGTLGADGVWKAKTTGSAAYKTRFVVRRPSNPASFKGTVVIEWLNVTVAEASPDWAYTHKAITDAGAAWIGLSVQALGVVGGKPLLQSGQPQQNNGGIKNTNAERYGSLEHPGDAYALDILSQVGAAVRAAAGAPVVGGAKVSKVIAAGESQSAAWLTGYINAIQPTANVFDGFFVHSRGNGAIGLNGLAGFRDATAGYHFRTDLDAPVMVFETETDVGSLQYAKAAQDDTDLLRVWEVTGTAHADAYLVNGAITTACPSPINSGPQHYVATAAMDALIRWVEDGTAPPKADRIQVGGDSGVTVSRDARGIALGGIRTPSVDVPVAALSGDPMEGGPNLCFLFGKTTAFDAATLKSLYPTKQAYLDAFTASLDKTIAAGFVRKAERDEYLAEAQAVALP